MKKIVPCFILACTAQLLTAGITHAQTVKNAQSTLKAPSGPITIDGNLKDWGGCIKRG